MPTKVIPTTTDDVKQWLTRLAPNRVQRLELRRSGGGDKRRIQIFDFPKAANHDLEELAKQVLGACESDGASRALQVVGYDLTASGPQSDEEGEATLSIRVKGASTGNMDEFDGPDMAAAFVHVLRANTELTKLCVSSRADAQDSLLRQLDYQAKRLDENDQRRLELYKLVEDLNASKIQQELDSAHMKLMERRQQMVSDKLDYYLPVVANRLLGGGPGKGKVPASEQLLTALLGKMGGNRIKAIMNGEPIALNDDERLILAEIYVSLAAQDEARKQRTSNADGNGAGTAKGSAEA